MIHNLVFVCAIGYASAGLVTYPNGAVVPHNPALEAATVGHIARKYAYGVNPYYGGLYGGVHYLGKREAEADAGYLGVYGAGYGYPAYTAAYPLAHYQPLVAHPNGAVVPLEPAAVVKARADHLATKY